MFNSLFLSSSHGHQVCPLLPRASLIQRLGAHLLCPQQPGLTASWTRLICIRLLVWLSN